MPPANARYPYTVEGFYTLWIPMDDPAWEDEDYDPLFPELTPLDNDLEVRQYLASIQRTN